MSHLHLSFASGIVRPMLATRIRPGSMGKFNEEAEIRCASMRETATVVDKETLTVIGQVVITRKGFEYVANNQE